VLRVAPLTDEHHRQLSLAVDRALQQWAPTLNEPKEIIAALDRVLLFLRQNGGASVQSRQVASLAFVFGAQVVRSAGWAWHSVSDDDHVNPAIVSADATRAVLVVDVVTELVLEATKGSLVDLHLACLSARAHQAIVSIAP
jgi:hypothetical protein